MALVKCPDCAGQLSTEAIACPHCGRPSRQPAQPPPIPGPRVGNVESAQPYQVSRQILPPTSAGPASSSQIPKTQQVPNPSRKSGTGLWNFLKTQCDLGAATMPARKLGIGLIVGIVLFPYVFAWFTLRKGHSANQRFLALGWMVVMFVAVRAGNMDKVGNVDRATERAPEYAATAQTIPYVQPAPVVRQEQQLTYVDETCFEVAEKFGTASGLSDLQMDEVWKAYRGKGFNWELRITEVSSDILGGFSVQAKCSPRSRSFIQDIQIEYPERAKAFVMGLRKGKVYNLRGTLSHQSALLGLGGSGLAD